MPTPKTPSASRTYVAICNRSDFSGYYFRKFSLPEGEENSIEHASWHFLNRLDFVACIDGVITLEDYQDLLQARE